MSSTTSIVSSGASDFIFVHFVLSHKAIFALCNLASSFLCTRLAIFFLPWTTCTPKFFLFLYCAFTLILFSCVGYLGVLGLRLICVCSVKFSLWFRLDLGVIGVL